MISPANSQQYHHIADDAPLSYTQAEDARERSCCLPMCVDMSLQLEPMSLAQVRTLRRMMSRFALPSVDGS